MSTELPKSFDSAAIEKIVGETWLREKLFHAEPTDPGEPFSIVIPPPNVTGALHLGHALNNTLQDVIVRWRRMCGDNAVWLPGTDHAGIATQAVVEKRLLKEGKRRTDFSRDEFIAIVQKWKDEYEARILGQLRAMGCSCDWDRTAFTMDEPRIRAVREAFFQFFKDGLIYRGKRLVNWDPATQTALADDEVENEEVDGFFYYLKYPLVDQARHANAERDAEQQYVTVATTRPETMLGDTAVAVNPKDPRAASLRGKFVKLPIVNRVVPIIEDDYVVRPISMGGDPADPKAQFATGFLKVTPAHDQNDWDIGQRHSLPVINVMGPDASISDMHGWPADDVARGDDFLRNELLGQSRDAAREKVVKWFADHGLLEDKKPYRHSVGHSYRSHVAIEPYLSDQWYLKVTDPRMAKAANAVLAMDQRTLTTSPERQREGKEPDAERERAGESPGADASGSFSHETVRFHPPRYAKMFQAWHDNVRDWCISRQLWWGHRIPVWRWRNAYWPDQPPAHTQMLACFLEEDRLWMLPDRVDPETKQPLPESDDLICVAQQDDEVEEFLRQIGAEQDPDVLDTWFSSALWPMSTLGWPDDTPSLQKWHPTSLLSTAREIITLWVSRMVMMNLYLREKIPFTNVLIHPVIQDGEGRRMSKSAGNGVDPLDIIETYGADAMRYTLATMATTTQDVRLPVERNADGKNTSAKFDLGRSFCVKLWNAAKFVLMNIESTPPQPIDELKWTMADRWIVSRFNRACGEAEEALATYRFDNYAKAIYDFFWRDFCDWYVEAAKPQMRNEQQKGQTAEVLAAVLDGVLRLMHPVIPFVTEILWWRLNEVRPKRGIPGRIEGTLSGGVPPRLVRAPFPHDSKNYSEAAEHIFPRIQELVVSIRNIRNEMKVDAKKPVTVSIKSSDNASRQIELLRPAIELLAMCSLVGVGSTVEQPAGSTRAAAGDCEVYVQAPTADSAADEQRIAKLREDLSKKIATLRGRLANEGYMAKAPAKLVQETRDQLAQAETELAKL
jgi:valyl-tRNA synthetase